MYNKKKLQDQRKFRLMKETHLKLFLFIFQTNETVKSTK